MQLFLLYRKLPVDDVNQVCLRTNAPFDIFEFPALIGFLCMSSGQFIAQRLDLISQAFQFFIIDLW